MGRDCPLVSSGSASASTGETLWLLGDHLGSIRDLVDNGGITRQHVVYDSFGNRLTEQGYDATGAAIASTHADAIDTLFGYTGRDWDSDVELEAEKGVGHLFFNQLERRTERIWGGRP